MSLYRRVAEIEAQGETAALCTVVKTTGSTPRRAGSKMLVFPDGRIEGTVGGGEMESRVVAEALAALGDGKPRMISYSMVEPQRGDPGVCGGTLEVYVEPILPRATVIVAGAGHVGRAVAELAHWMGFRVVVTDDREGFVGEETIPQADKHLEIPLSQVPDKEKIHSQTFIVLTTRSVDVDVEGLPALLESEAAYIGVIGSRRRWETTRGQLLEKGLSEERIDWVRSPVGLKLGAETPEEIAVSIMAEVVKVWRGE